jgi:transketolase C-terminal domain/subunit
VRTGGLGSAVAEVIAEMPGQRPVLRRLSLPDAFPAHYGSQAKHLAEAGLSAAGVLAALDGLP